MTTATPLYGTPTALTITLASLATDANLLVGRESTSIDQSGSTDAIDVILGGKITTGSSPTASRQIEVWVYGSWDGTEYTAAATGSNAALTVTAESKVAMKLATVIPTHGTSDTAYTFLVGSLARLFGGVLPVKWGVYVVHNTGVNLNSTGGNHEIYYTALKYESA